jgi:5-methylthioadenosine/S-adenosylhomocysteine deaminase
MPAEAKEVNAQSKIYSADLVLPITSPPIEDGAVVVKNERIIFVGKRKTAQKLFSNFEERNFTSALIMPGLINLHTHSELGAFSSLARPTEFLRWLVKLIKKSRQFTAKDWFHSAEIGVKKCLRAGITAIADITRTGQGFQAALSQQLRGIIFFEIVGVDNRDVDKRMAELKSKIEQSKHLLEKESSKSLTIGLSPHSVYTLSSSALRVVLKHAAKERLPTAIHLAETQAEVEFTQQGSGDLANFFSNYLNLDLVKTGGLSLTPFQYLVKLGALRVIPLLIHGVWLTEADLDLIKREELAIIFCLKSNEMLQVGEAPVSRVLQKKIRFGLGTDSAASVKELDLFGEIRKLREIAQKQGSSFFLSDKELVELITIKAAELIRMRDLIGSLEVGKLADMAVVEIEGAKFGSPYSYLVDQATASNIIYTLIGGKLVYGRIRESSF